MRRYLEPIPVLSNDLGQLNKFEPVCSSVKESVLGVVLGQTKNFHLPRWSNLMKKLYFSSFLAVFASPLYADDFRPAMESYLQAEISIWMNNPVLIQAIKSQNSRTEGFEQAKIDELDQTWRAEVGSGSSEIIASVIENEAADFLRQKLEQSSGVISEIFVMDAHGLNVAASTVTSDYWQGDEAKFQQTYQVGPDAVHYGDVEFDESSQSYQGQISVVIIDPDSRQPIGAITIGVNAEELI